MLLRRPHDLGTLFREGRARSGWSQTQLAERVGVSRQWISLVETGKTSVEFDLVVSALQALGYALHVGPPGPPTSEGERLADHPEPVVHRASERTPLTRRGEPLGRERMRRRRKEDGRG